MGGVRRRGGEGKRGEEREEGPMHPEKKAKVGVSVRANLSGIILSYSTHTAHSRQVNGTLDYVSCTLFVRRHSIYGPWLNLDNAERVLRYVLDWFHSMCRSNIRPLFGFVPVWIGMSDYVPCRWGWLHQLRKCRNRCSLASVHWPVHLSINSLHNLSYKSWQGTICCWRKTSGQEKNDWGSNAPQVSVVWANKSKFKLSSCISMLTPIVVTRSMCLAIKRAPIL